MKSFLISLTFLAALVIGAAFNCNYVTDILSYTNNTLSQLCLDAGKISNDSFSEKAVAILDFWNSKKIFSVFQHKRCGTPRLHNSFAEFVRIFIFRRYLTKERFSS